MNEKISSIQEWELQEREIVDLDVEGGARLIGSQCRACNLVFFPPGRFCPDCITDNPAAILLNRKGTLYSYSVVHIAPKGWTSPYVIGYVDLPEGVRVFSHISISDASALHPDMLVELDIGPIREDDAGNALISFRFVPASSGNAK